MVVSGIFHDDIAVRERLRTLRLSLTQLPVTDKVRETTEFLIDIAEKNVEAFEDETKKLREKMSELFEEFNPDPEGPETIAEQLERLLTAEREAAKAAPDIYSKVFAG